jgi:hypothetical protein
MQRDGEEACVEGWLTNKECGIYQKIDNGSKTIFQDGISEKH